MSARMRHSLCVHPRSIRFSRCTPRGSSGPTGPRGKEIYCQTGGPPRAGIWAHTFPTHIRTLGGLDKYKRGPRFRGPLFRLSIVIDSQMPYASSLRPDSSIASSAASASAASVPLAKMYSLILGSVPEGRTIPLLPPSRSNSMTLAFGRPFTQVL